MTKELIVFMELLSFPFGIISTYLLIIGRYQTFIIGLFNTLPFIFISVYRGVYAEAFIFAYLSVMNVIGWVGWRGDRIQKKAVYTYTSRILWMCIALILPILWGALCWGLRAQTDSKVVLLDGLATALAIIAMWMNVQKKIDAWALWILSDIVNVFLFFEREAIYAALQFFLYTFMGCWGWYVWHKNMRLSSSE